MNYKTKVKHKHLVISSSSDISKLHKDIISIHLRKYVSKRLIAIILKRCPRLKRLSLSRYAYSRIDPDLIPSSIELTISDTKGRHSMLDKIMLCL